MRIDDVYADQAGWVLMRMIGMIHPPSKIVALNVQAGGGSRVGAICRFLEYNQPDVVVLTDWRKNAGGREFRNWFEEKGMRCVALNDGSTRNGVAIASRAPFHAKSVTPSCHSAGALLLAQFQGLALLGGYFPLLRTKSFFFAACAEMANEHAKAPFLFVGDLNTGNQVTDKSAGGARYRCAAGFDALSREAGLTDLWRRTHGNDAREWTWHSRKNGFRIDHAFGNERFLQQFGPSCSYDHASREGRLTDHSAVIVTGTGLEIAG